MRPFRGDLLPDGLAVSLGKRIPYRLPRLLQLTVGCPSLLGLLQLLLFAEAFLTVLLLPEFLTLVVADRIGQILCDPTECLGLGPLDLHPFDDQRNDATGLRRTVGLDEDP